MKKSTNRASWRKYINIIIPVGLMLLTIAAVIIFVFFANQKVASETNTITLAGKQEALVQNIKNSIYNIDLYNKQLSSIDGQSAEYARTMDGLREELLRLKRTRDSFDESLRLFKNGGQMALSESNYVSVSPLREPRFVGAIDNAIAIWQPYQRLIDSLAVEIDNRQINPETVAYATDYARIFNERLYLEVRDIGLKEAEKIDRLNFVIQMVMIAGLLIAILLVFYIIIVALRQLLRSDSQLEEARKETSQIMATVNEGLFLIDRDLQIGQQYSTHLEKIIGQRNIGGQNMTNLLASLVSEEDLQVVRTFVRQLYNERVVEDLIHELNPLNRIHVNVSDFVGGTISRYLDFKFSRVYSGEEITSALVSVVDVTEAVMLETRLEQEREQNDQQIEMLNTILNADESMMNQFIATTQRRIVEINGILREPEKTQDAMENKLRHIYREAHSIKGESSAMGLTPFVLICERFEEKIKKLQEKPRLVGNDFLSLTVILDELLGLGNLIEKLNKRLSNMAVGKAQSENGESPSKMSDFYQQFAADIAKRNHKKVVLHCEGMDKIPLSDNQKTLVQDLSIQFLRNAIVHGIENEQERQRLGKSSSGSLKLLLKQNEDNTAELLVEDDGHGIDYASVRAKAVEKGLYPAEEAEKLTNKQLLALLFSSGFSTAGESNEDAGRGVGMDIVKDRINQLKGKLKMASSAERYTRFSVTFPLQK